MSVANEPLDQQQYLTFFLGEQEYAISILRVKEIIEYGNLTKVPRMPVFIRGVINLRGSVVPVIDLAVKFGMPESHITKWTCLIIVEADLEGEQTVMGVIADAVNQVVDLSSKDVEPPPAFGTRIRIDYLLGMGKVENKFALILDMDRVLSIDELVAVDSMVASEQQAGEPTKAPGLLSA